jgi:hypothetical protein
MFLAALVIYSIGFCSAFVVLALRSGERKLRSGDTHKAGNSNGPKNKAKGSQEHTKRAQHIVNR